MIRRFAAGGLLKQALRSHRLRSGDGHSSGDGFFSPGTQERGQGYLFNETPPPPGQSRKWEDWELPYYITGVLTFLILGIGLNSKPDTSIESWARKK
eukprot:c16708_g2_i1 orf=259-549(+)